MAVVGAIKLLFSALFLGATALIDRKMWLVATTPESKVLAIAAGTVFAVYALALSVKLFDD